MEEFMNREDIYLNEEIEYGFGKKLCFKFQGICSSLNVDKNKINKQSLFHAEMGKVL